MTEWEDFSEVVTGENGILTFEATSSDGLVTMTFTIKPAGDDEVLTANSMKADVRITEFPWTEGENGYLALISDVESSLEVDADEEAPDELDEVEDAGGPETTEDEPIEETEPTEEEEPEDPTEDRATRALDSKSKKPVDVKIPFATVVDTVGFSPLGKVTWAETAVAAAATSPDIEGVTAVGRSQETILVIATSPPLGSERYLADQSSQPIAFSFIGDAAQGSPDIFWDPEAGVAYDVVESSDSGICSLVTTFSVVGGFVSALLLLIY